MIVSIIIPLYKGNKYISKIIRMLENNLVLLGKKTMAELIFVNDYPEERIECRSSQMHNLQITYIDNEDNMGIHRSKINGLSIAKGSFVLFLDQDDTISNDYLKQQLELMKQQDAVISNGYYRTQKKIFETDAIVKEKCNWRGYLEYGYPLVSLGQMLVRRESIPAEWKDHVLMNNGWDDHLMWACLMLHNKSIVYNPNFLYTHEEDGTNESYNWSGMRQSGEEYLSIVESINMITAEEKNKINRMITKKFDKYDKYIQLDKLWNNVGDQHIIKYMRQNPYRKVAIYGMGVYGIKLVEVLMKSGIEIAYGIDKCVEHNSYGISVYRTEQMTIPVDIIISSTGYCDEEICLNLKGNSIGIYDLLLQIKESVCKE